MSEATETFYRCDNCSRRRMWGYLYPETARVVCVPCIEAPDAHIREFPDCTDLGHDGYSHNAGLVKAVEAEAWKEAQE